MTRSDGHVLVVNAGSTSVKLSAFGPGDEPVWRDSVPAGRDVAAVLVDAPLETDTLVGVGHRIVHGGDRFGEPVVVDAGVEDAIAALADLAPLHNRAGLDGIAAARRALGPGVPHVAVFDTSFHRTIPLAAAAYGGPYEWLVRGLRRYGFHGISHAEAARQAAVELGRPIEDLALVTCHLGGGCSLAAVGGGRSVDTTMGFTPLDGLVMATRSGAVDPGLVLRLLRQGDSLDDVEDVLEHRSGLLGLSGVSADLREVLAARDRGDERARLAIDVFVHRVATGVGAMAAALGRVDAIVFTGGIGEHAPEVRRRVADRVGFLGARVVVVPAGENLFIARSVRDVLNRW